MKEAADFDQMAKSFKADFPYLYYSKCSVRRNSHTMGVACLILRVVATVVFVPVYCCRGVCSRCSVKLADYGAPGGRTKPL